MGEINASDKSSVKIKKRKYGNKINFYINHHIKDCFEMEFMAC